MVEGAAAEKVVGLGIVIVVNSYEFTFTKTNFQKKEQLYAIIHPTDMIIKVVLSFFSNMILNSSYI